MVSSRALTVATLPPKLSLQRPIQLQPLGQRLRLALPPTVGLTMARRILMMVAQSLKVRR
jgi:hypothetical protein